MSTEIKTMDISTFDEVYKPLSNHILDDENIFHFENYGVELEFVKSQDERNVWSLIDDEDNNAYLINGLHYDNVYSYVVTEKKWDEGETFKILYHEDFENAEKREVEKQIA